MERYTISEDLLIQGWPKEGSHANIKEGVSDIKGVEHVDITGQNIHVEFYPYLVSRDQITERISSLGCTINIQKKKKGFFSRYLEKMAESNKQQFGNGPLDCCKLKK